MYRMTALCMALLLVSGTAVADDTVSADKAPQKAAPKPPASEVEKASPAKHTKKDRLKGVPVAAVQNDKAKDDPNDSAKPAQPAGDVKMSGMSILGNEEAPKSLVIVPWKSSQMGDMPGVSRLLDPATQPVDKDVFMRELAYYEIRSSAH
jgi:hypothetical protein